MARSDGGRAAPTGVVGVAEIPLLIWLSATVRTTPALADGRGLPSLSKEGNFGAESRDRDQLEPAVQKTAETPRRGELAA